MMNIPGWLILDIYVMLLAWMLFFFVLHKKQKTRQDNAFMMLLGTVIVLLCGDILSRCNPNGKEGISFILARIGNYIIFAGDPIGYLTAMQYIRSWISVPQKTRADHIVTDVVTFYVIANIIGVSISDFCGFGWFYSFPDRIYQRGPLYVPRGILNMIFCLIIGMYILLRRRDIRTQYTNYVIAFPVIVLFSGMLQVFAGGASYEYAGTIFACLLLYIYVQNHNMDTDYLTGLLNRKGIDEELLYRIQHASDTDRFTTCLLDLDFFKNINDDYGHEAGDEALRTMSVLLKQSFGHHAVIGRYGGDEFLILFEASTDKEAEVSLQKLAERCHDFNQKKGRTDSFCLSFSAGYAVYNAAQYQTMDDYIRVLDQRMYNEKILHHALRNHAYAE